MLTLYNNMYPGMAINGYHIQYYICICIIIMSGVETLLAMYTQRNSYITLTCIVLFDDVFIQLIN